MLGGYRRASWSALLVLLVAIAVAAGCGSSGSNNGSGTDAGMGDDATGTKDGPIGFGGDAASSLTISPQNPVLNVSAPGVTLQFKALENGQAVPATWTIDVADIGTIDSTGLFVASGSLGGPTTVTAQVGNMTAKTLLTVKLTLTDNSGNVPPGTQGQLQGGGSADPTFKWLYPYNATVFPRGINPPVLQTGGTGWDAAYLHISFSTLDFKGFYGPSTPERLALTAGIWKAITLGAQSTDTVKVELTKISGGKVTGPVTEGWTIAQGTLRGTVYYNSYDSPLAGNTGAIMSVRPGQAAKVVIAGCRVCHTVSADGSTLVAANEPTGGTATDRVWDLKNNLNTLYDAPNREWAFGALYPDGSKFLRFGVVPDTGMAGASWAPNVRGLGQFGDLPSLLYDTKTGTDLKATGQPAHMMMPIFSPDGKMVAFNHYDTGTGHTIAVMSFDNKTNTFSGLKDIATMPNSYVGWPAFTPDDKFVFFAAGTDIEYDTISDDTTAIPNPTSDLYAAHIATTTNAMQNELDGIDASGKYYLPFGEMNEGHLNYEPTILPEAVGGYFWVVFTTRRDYGNLVNGDAYVGTGGGPSPRKKLWVAAVDIDTMEHPILKAQDLTHPAFYLDGQELAAGNMRGFWALDPCESNGMSCQTGDECCSGFCRQQSGPDGGMQFVCVPPTGCAQEGEKCTTAADCCGASMGTQCIAGFCATPLAQ
jgi:WD40 repeat protein